MSVRRPVRRKKDINLREILLKMNFFGNMEHDTPGIVLSHSAVVPDIPTWFTADLPQAPYESIKVLPEVPYEFIVVLSEAAAQSTTVLDPSKSIEVHQAATENKEKTTVEMDKQQKKRLLEASCEMPSEPCEKKRRISNDNLNESDAVVSTSSDNTCFHQEIPVTTKQNFKGIDHLARLVTNISLHSHKMKQCKRTSEDYNQLNELMQKLEVEVTAICEIENKLLIPNDYTIFEDIKSQSQESGYRQYFKDTLFLGKRLYESLRMYSAFLDVLENQIEEFSIPGSNCYELRALHKKATKFYQKNPAHRRIKVMRQKLILITALFNKCVKKNQ